MGRSVSVEKCRQKGVLLSFSTSMFYSSEGTLQTGNPFRTDKFKARRLPKKRSTCTLPPKTNPWLPLVQGERFFATGRQ